MTSRKIAAFVLCACLLMMGGVFAQEPEPTPTDTPTLAPTDTPTNTDTPNPMPTDTATDTDTPSPIPTDTPTDMETATDTPTESPVPTSTDTPDESLYPTPSIPTPEPESTFPSPSGNLLNPVSPLTLIGSNAAIIAPEDAGLIREIAINQYAANSTTNYDIFLLASPTTPYLITQEIPINTKITIWGQGTENSLLINTMSFGNAFYVYSGGELELHHVKISTTNNGRAVRVQQGVLRAYDSEFYNNNQGIYNYEGRLTLERVGFRLNGAASGGAIFSQYAADTSYVSVNITCSQFISNNASGWGGGIRSINTRMIVQNSEFRGNTQQGYVPPYDELARHLYHQRTISPVYPARAANNYWLPGSLYNTTGNDVLFIPMLSAPPSCPMTPPTAIPTLVTPTPTPTATPTGEVCPAGQTLLENVCQQPLPSFTNLDLTTQGIHRAARAGIFFAIWNETSEDRQYYGDDPAISSSTLTPQELETRYRDTQARGASSFLVGGTYCTSGQNLRNDEPPANPQGWASTISNIDHCEDHRYLDANVIINGYLRYERIAPFDPSNPDATLGAIFGYLSQNFQGTFSGPAAGRDLWSNIPSCGSRGYLSPYPGRLTSQDASRNFEYYNFDELVNQIGTIFALNSERRTKDQDLRALDPNDPANTERIAQLTAELAAINANIQQYPGLFRIQNIAMRWLEGYLACINAGSSSAIQIKSPRIEAQIERAVNNLYQQGPDPTGGAFNRRNPNTSVSETTTIVYTLSIPLALNSVNSSNAELYFSNNQTDGVSNCNNYAEGVPNTHQYIDILRVCYRTPNLTTVVKPVLLVDVDRNGSPAGFVWLAISYQLEGDPPQALSRYDYDICEDGNKCL